MTFNDNVENYRNDRVDKRLSPVKRRMFNDDESTSKLENYRNDHNKRIKTSLDADKYGRELGHNSRNSKTSASSSDSSQLPRLQNHIPSSSSPQSPSIESSITSPSSSLENDLSSQQSTSLNPIFENDVVSSQSPPSNPILENDVFSSQSPPSNTSSRRSGRTRIRNKYIWSDDFTEVGHRYKKGRDNSTNCAFIQSFD